MLKDPNKENISHKTPNKNSCNIHGCSSCTKIRLIMLAILLIIILFKLLQSAEASEGTWPKTLQTPSGELTLYQPQPESYDSTAATIEARAALSFKKNGDTAPKFGAILFTARYEVERDSRTALLKNITLKDWKFPDATPEQASKLQHYLNEAISDKAVPTSLDELIHSLKGANNDIKDESRLNNTPPAIIYREQPAALVVIDGKPLKKPIEGTAFERVINTPLMLLYYPQESAYYLNGNNLWFTTTNIHGKWLQASRLPAGLEETGSQADVIISLLS